MMLLIAKQSLSDLRRSSSPEVCVSQKAGDRYQFGSSLSNKPKKHIPKSGAELQHEAVFFSLGK